MHSSMNTVGKQTFLRIAADYIESLGGRDLRVCVFGEKVAEPVDHPPIRPSVNAAAATCMLANVCKHYVTKSPYEIGRLAQDLARRPGRDDAVGGGPQAPTDRRTAAKTPSRPSRCANRGTHRWPAREAPGTWTERGANPFRTTRKDTNGGRPIMTAAHTEPVISSDGTR